MATVPAATAMKVGTEILATEEMSLEDMGMGLVNGDAPENRWFISWKIPLKWMIWEDSGIFLLYFILSLEEVNGMLLK